MDKETNITFWPFFMMLLLFLGQNVLDVLNYPQSDPASGALYRLHPATYMLFVLWAIQNIKNNTLYNVKSPSVRFFGIVVLVAFVYSITFGKSKGNFFILDTLFAPVLIVQLLQDASEETKAKVLYWLKVFFVINCLLAILERGLSKLVFQPTVEFVFDSFRSYALLGHPLNNGLVIGFLTLFFVIISETTTQKFLYLGLGLLAIFAFGARAALAGVLIAFPFILYVDLKNYTTEIAAEKFFNYLFLFFIMMALCAFILINTPFGERILAGSKFDDDSADARSRVFDMFRQFNPGELILGIPEHKILRVMYLEKVEIIENFWVVWIFKYGIIITFFLGLFLINFLFSLFNQVRSPVRFIMVVVFFFIASGNNSLATNTTAISIITTAAMVCFQFYSPEIAEEQTYEEEHNDYLPVLPDVTTD